MLRITRNLLHFRMMALMSSLIISLVLVNENGKILLDDFGKETKRQCKQYVREEVFDFLSGKTNQYMKDNQGGGWYTDCHIADFNESFKEYLSRYSGFIGCLGK